MLIDRSMLLQALNDVLPVVPARSPKPVLQNVRLDASPDGATLTATDLDVAITRRVLGVKAVDAPTAILMPPAKLKAILASVPDPEIALEVDGDVLEVRAERGRWKLPTEDPDQYPAPPDRLDAPPWSVEADALKLAIRRTVFATDPDSTRYALGGVLLEVGEGKVSLIGTDGRRLAWQAIPADSDASEVRSVVPTKTLRLIDRTMDGVIEVRATPEAIDFQADGCRIYSRLVEGRFPSWREAMPKDHAWSAEIDAATLLQAVEQAAITTSKGTRGIDFTHSDGVLSLKARSADVGESDIQLHFGQPVPDFAFTLDGTYTREVLATLDGTITLEGVDSRSPITIRVEGYTHVLMPLNRER